MVKKHILIMMLCPLLMACTSHASQPQKNWEISELQAKASVFEALQIEENDCEYLNIEKKIMDGQNIYQITLQDDEREYFYAINRHNGEILSSTQKKLQDLPSQEDTVLQHTGKQEPIQAEQTESKTNQQPIVEVPVKDNNQTNQSNAANKNNTASQDLLSREQIIAMIVKKVPGVNQNHIELELDREDGKTVYEGEFVHEQLEYEFEINAKNGSFLKWSIEHND